MPIYQWPAPLEGSMYEQVATSSVRTVTVLNPGRLCDASRLATEICRVCSVGS